MAHTYQVRSTLRSMSAWVDGAKADVRGYLVTGDSGYIVKYLTAVDSAGTTFDRLKMLTADNPSQQTTITTLRPLLELRRQKLAQTIALGPMTGAHQSEYVARLQEGEALSAQIDDVLARMDSAEVSLLARRAVAEHRSQDAVAVVVVVLLLLAIAVTWFMRRLLVRDITDRARIEAQLRASEARFAGILSIAADAIVSIDDTGAIVNFNHGAETMFGYAAADMLGQSLDRLIPGRHVHAHHQHLRDFAASPESARRMGERREVAGRRRDGTEFPADVSISKLGTPTGTVFTAVVRDVTEQRRLEHHEHTLAVAGARLAGSLDYEATLRAVCELPVHAIGDWCLLDVIERREGAPATLRRIVSDHVDLLRHQGLQSIATRGLHWDSPADAIDVIRTNKPRLQSVVTDDWLEAHAENAAELADLLRLGVGSCLSVPLTVHEEVIGALTIGRHAATLGPQDLALAAAFAVTAGLAIASAELHRAAQRALGTRDEVLAIVSHDLRTPASAITMCARTLLEHPPESADARRALYATVLESANWMHRLMRDLLDAASIDAGRLSIEIESQELYPVLQTAMESAAHDAAQAGFALHVEVAYALPMVKIDRDRTLQALTNLVGNAVRFTASGGAVTISAIRAGDDVCISVRDSGTGIPPDHLPHLFDRFWQARQRGIGRGTGLGLAIAKGIVEAQAGRIRVDSVVGHGSTFSFTVPAA